jgi:hypothetical protein
MSMQPALVLTLLALAVDCRMPPTTCAGELAGVDVNGDGKADVRTVMRDGRELCRDVDLNFDGRPDVVKLGGDGPVVWTASDFDFDGRADRIEVTLGPDARYELLDLDFDARPDVLRAVTAQVAGGG